MSNWIRESDEKYPVSKTEIVIAHGNVSFPKVWDGTTPKSFGYAFVNEVARPEITATQRLVEGQPEQRQDGLWYQTWAVQNFSTEEVAALLVAEKDAACARLNSRRDALQYSVFTDSHGHSYDVDSKGREKMTGLEANIANGLTLPTGFSWTGADNEERPHDNVSFLALTTEILLWTSTVHGICVGAKSAVRAAEDVAGVAAIEALVVWP